MSDHTFDVRITDTSLRDGSHHKRHQFTTEEVQSIVAALDGAGVPVIARGRGEQLSPAPPRCVRICLSCSGNLSLHFREAHAKTGVSGRVKGMVRFAQELIFELGIRKFQHAAVALNIDLVPGVI